MLKNYIKIAWRNLIRNRAYSLINVLGLAVGIASCLLIFLFIQDELSYDEYHKNSDRLYRVYRSAEYQGEKEKTLATSNLLGPTLEKEIPEVSGYMRLSNKWLNVMVEEGKQKYKESKFFFADPSIFEMFSFKLLKGNPDNALDRPFTVVITENMAHKYFGDANAIGKTLTIRGSWGADDYEVTGVMGNIRHDSHFSFNFLTSMQTLRSKTPDGSDFASWYHIGSYTYVMLESGVKSSNLTNDLNKFVKRHFDGKRASFMQYKLQPITDIHLYSHFEEEIEPNGDIRYLYIFGSIALLILIIAGINYMNLATARSADRAMEVGIRKTLGVDRKRLIGQFLSESFVFCLISLVLGLLFAEIMLPYFNSLTGKPLSLDILDPQLLLAILAVLLLVGILAGLYPAFVLSGFNPREVFSGAVGGRKKSNLRNALVVFQFAISIVLIAGTLVINNQMDHVRNKRLGFNQEQVLTLSTAAGREFKKNYNAFKDRLLSYPDIKSITHINLPIPTEHEVKLSLTPQGKKKSLKVSNFSVGKNFVKTLQVPLKKGMSLSDLSADTMSDNIPVLINEAAAQEWGWQEPLGKTIDGFSPKFKVAGVVGNFHYRSLKTKIGPLVLWPNSYSVRNVMIRIGKGKISETMSRIEEAWDEMGPGTPMNYSFADDRFDAMYKSEDRLAMIFGSFSILGIVIACLGLLGLAAYTAERRTKEIGVRKVMGATVTNIITLLSKDFMKLVLLGFVIAVPVAWYSMHQWLTDFAYRIEIGAGVFIIAGGAAFLIALLTVSWQAARAAVANPVESLRTE